MPSFSAKPQSGGARPQTFASSLDQLKELTKIPGEGFKELFGMGQNQSKTPFQEEQILFDGAQARKKAQKTKQEQENQIKIHSLQVELARMAQEEQTLRGELTEISETVVHIAKSVDIETPHGIEKIPAKPGIYHKVFYMRILEEFRKKADEAKDWRAAQQVRVSSKPARGSLLWVGDQKKVHEAGGMFLLQG